MTTIRCLGNRAAAAIEFALVAPMLLVMLAGVVELNLAIHKKMQVQFAAQLGALYAVEHGWNSLAIAATVVNASAGAGVSANPAPAQFCGCPTVSGIVAVACGGTCSNGDAAGSYVRVSALAARQSILAYSTFSLPANVTGRATVRLQ